MDLKDGTEAFKVELGGSFAIKFPALASGMLPFILDDACILCLASAWVSGETEVYMNQNGHFIPIA